MSGFRVTVVDDREAYANPERFPDATETLVAPFPEAVARMPIQANTYVVVVTRGHKEDKLALEALAARAAAGEAPKFLGMIGSKVKRGVLFRHLRAEGVDEDFLEKVRSPVGICVGARTHEEIAVAIVAELISVRRLGLDAVEGWRHYKHGRLTKPTRADGTAGDTPSAESA